MRILRRFRKKISIFLFKSLRLVTGKPWNKEQRTERQKRILGIFRTLVSNKENRVYFTLSPDRSTFYLVPKDRKYLVRVTDRKIKISNHKLFFNEDINKSVYDEMISMAKKRYNDDLLKINEEMEANEDKKLEEAYLDLRKTKNKTQSILENISSKVLNIEKIKERLAQ